MSVEAFEEDVDLERIADTVLHRGVRHREADQLRIKESVVMTYGAKQLSVWVDMVDRLISTHITSTDGDQKPYETTVLYLAAKKFMQSCVDGLGTKYKYQLQTKDPHMRDWAHSTGEEIFHWTDVSEVPNGNELYAGFGTIFSPKSDAPDQEAT